MTIASAFNELAVANGGTADSSGTIAGAIDALTDALAGSDIPEGRTIEDNVKILGEHLSGGGGETVEFAVGVTADNGTSWLTSNYGTVTANGEALAAKDTIASGATTVMLFEASAGALIEVLPPDDYGITEEGTYSYIDYNASKAAWIAENPMLSEFFWVENGVQFLFNVGTGVFMVALVDIYAL